MVLVIEGCPRRRRCPNVELDMGGGVCSCRGRVPRVLVGTHGETGVEGGVNGLNPAVGFLS